MIWTCGAYCITPAFPRSDTFAFWSLWIFVGCGCVFRCLHPFVGFTSETLCWLWWQIMDICTGFVQISVSVTVWSGFEMHSALWEIVLLCCAAELVSVATHSALSASYMITSSYRHCIRRTLDYHLYRCTVHPDINFHVHQMMHLFVSPREH